MDGRTSPGRAAAASHCIHLRQTHEQLSPPYRSRSWLQMSRQLRGSGLGRSVSKFIRAGHVETDSGARQLGRGMSVVGESTADLRMRSLLMLSLWRQ